MTANSSSLFSVLGSWFVFPPTRVALRRDLAGALAKAGTFASKLNTNGEARTQKCERLRQCKAFTLIELLIVMSLIVILAGIGLAVHANSQTRAKEAVLKEDLFRMRDAIDQYFADKNTYPPSLESLVSEKYLRAVPADPFTNSSTTWQVTMSEIDPANPSAQAGVFDVKSGSEGRALDGTSYAEW